MSENLRMQPVIISPVGAVSKADMRRLNRNGFVVVEAKDPSAVRFMEPPPEGYNTQEKAAIALCRYLLSNENGLNRNRTEIQASYSHFLLEGWPLRSVQELAKA